LSALYRGGVARDAARLAVRAGEQAKIIPVGSARNLRITNMSLGGIWRRYFCKEGGIMKKTYISKKQKKRWCPLLV
jgi:hypothetical protein